MKKLLLLLVIASSSAMAAVDPEVCDMLADTARTMSQHRDNGATYDGVIEGYKAAIDAQKNATPAQRQALFFMNKSIAQRVYAIPEQPDKPRQKAAEAKLAADITWECLTDPQQ